MSLFFIIAYLLQLWMAIYLVLPFIFLLIYAAKKISRTRYNISKKTDVHPADFDFAAIITAHQDISLVPALVDSLLKQHYTNYLIYIVADNCADIPVYDDPRVVVLKPATALNSKVRSIDFAISRFVRPHDALIILDSDNLVHPRFLPVINQYFRKGFRAVQSNLQPKNSDSIFARLDAMGDTFHNFIEREIRMELGLSSAIWGSGIAIETELYRQIIYDSLLGGFDKRIQADLVRKIPQLAFAREAIIYDEKISSGASLEKQRTRWLHAYFKYLKLGWQTFTLGLRQANFNLAFFGFVNLRPPLFLLFCAAATICIFNYWTRPWLFFSWLTILFLFVFSFLAIIVLKSTNKKTIWSIFFMPVFILYQLAALVHIRRARKSFLKTDHNKLVYIEDLVPNERR